MKGDSLATMDTGYPTLELFTALFFNLRALLAGTWMSIRGDLFPVMASRDGSTLRYQEVCFVEKHGSTRRWLLARATSDDDAKDGDVIVALRWHLWRQGEKLNEDELVRQLRAVCDESSVLLIADAKGRVHPGKGSPFEEHLRQKLAGILQLHQVEDETRLRYDAAAVGPLSLLLLRVFYDSAE